MMSNRPREGLLFDDDGIGKVLKVGTGAASSSTGPPPGNNCNATGNGFHASIPGGEGAGFNSEVGADVTALLGGDLDLPEDLDPDTIMKMLDAGENMEVETLNSTTLKKLVLQLQKKKKVNQERRVEFFDTPEKFMDSEVDLNEHILKLKDIAAAPELYAEFNKLGGITTLIALLAHTNTDIVVSVLDVLKELTAPDTFDDLETGEEFAQNLLDSNLCEMLTDCFGRIDEGLGEDDARGITDALNILENLAEIGTQYILGFALHEKFVTWLLKRVSRDVKGASTDTAFDSNKAYAAELLNIFISDVDKASDVDKTRDEEKESDSKKKRRRKNSAGDDKERSRSHSREDINDDNETDSEDKDKNKDKKTPSFKQETLINLEGTRRLMNAIAPYRKHEPKDSVECEFVENIFGSLCDLMLLPGHQAAFNAVNQGAGMEVLVRIMNLGGFCAKLAIQLASMVCLNQQKNCNLFIDRGGLKVLFAFFMRKGGKAMKKKDYAKYDEFILSLIQSLTRHCTGNNLARVMNKFTENRFEKLEHLFELHNESSYRLTIASEQRKEGLADVEEELQLDEADFYVERCEEGLAVLQQCDLAILRLYNSGNRQLLEAVEALFSLKGVSKKSILETVDEYMKHLDPESEEVQKEIKELNRYMKAFLKK